MANTRSRNKRFLIEAAASDVTFFRDFEQPEGFDLTADYPRDVSRGDHTGTFTRTAGDTTYIDKDGVVQVQAAADTPRFTKGYYDSTGWHTQAGLMIEGASTNLIKYGLFSAGTGTATNWNISEDDTNNDTPTLVDATDLINISGTQAQRVQMTFSGDGTYLNIYSDSTAVGSFAQNDYASISCWLKGSSSGLTIKLRIVEADAADASGSGHNSADLAGSISSTEWRRFTYSVQLTDADLSRAKFIIGVEGIDASDAIDIQITGAQLEKLPFASSFIPTTTAAVARGAEKLLYPLTGNRTAVTESAVFKLSTEFANGVTGTKHITSTGTKARSVFFTTDNPNNEVKVFPNVTDSAASGVTDLIDDTWTAYTVFTLGYSMQQADPYVTTYLDGVVDGTPDTSDDYTTPVWDTGFSLGSNSAGDNPLYGTIQAVAFFSSFKNATEHATLAEILNLS